MIPRLIALSGPLAGDTFTLEKEATTIGRDPENDIVVDAQWVSRSHCRIERTEDGFKVTDRDSHNGTMVNDVPIKEKALRSGDRVSFGGASFLYVDQDLEPGKNWIELEDSPLPSRATVALRARDSLYLAPERLDEAPLAGEDARKALSATLSIIQLLGRGDAETLPERILERFFKVLPAERGAILMGDRLEELDSITMRLRKQNKPTSFAVSRTVLTKVFEEKTALLGNRVQETPGAGKSLLASKVQSLVCLPLMADDRLFGAVYLDSRDPKAEFPESQLDLLMGMTGVAASALEKARQLGRLRAEKRRLTEELNLVHNMVGESARLKEAQAIIARAAPSDTTVLIEGESGTGKELAARAIHFNSERRDGPLVKVDCTGLNENLLASELFGHERGAFTGAIQQKKGKIEIADGGTVFLDEVGELPMALQAQLLRVLQDREFERVGGTRPISVDIRLVAATNRDLAEEVERGRFRKDLYYRLNVVKLSLPPLRERSEDVELLAQYYVSEFAKKVKRTVAGISPEALAVLKRHDWPGNIRELANTIERAVVLGTTELILPEDLPEMLVETRTSGPAPSSFHEAVAEKKKDLILDAVARAGGNITEAGRLLGLHPNYLHRLIRNLGLRDQIKSG